MNNIYTFLHPIISSLVEEKKAERTFRKRIPTFSFSSIREELEDVKTADEISLALMGG